MYWLPNTQIVHSIKTITASFNRKSILLPRADNVSNSVSTVQCVNYPTGRGHVVQQTGANFARVDFLFSAV